MNIRNFYLVFCLAVFLSACSTIRTPFTYSEPKYDQLPMDALQAAADKLESQVHAGNREPDLENADGLILNTPEIHQALRSRAARIEILNEFMARGNAYEESNGLIHIVRTKEYKLAYSRQQRDRDALLIMGENENRWALYEGIIEANDFPGGSTSAIQKIFFDARVKHLPSGIKYEDAGGAITTK